ncbi:hypothetical protein KR084_010794 [Drosophila pseudotakahashii]|nr:hypothetical protein KR084_010794 [Drosophila pseudotakahashii]
MDGHDCAAKTAGQPEEAMQTVEGDTTKELSEEERANLETKQKCSSLIEEQMLESTPEDLMPPAAKKKREAENYAPKGITFRGVVEGLDPTLSTAAVFYAILQLASEQNLRLLPHENLKDFTIRQILDDKEG